MATLAMEEGLIAGLKGNAGIAALVGVRVYGTRLPQRATLPCVTTARISTPRSLTHDTKGKTGTAHPRFQIDAWSVTEEEAKAISDAVREYLNGFSGTVTSGADSVKVQAAYIDDEQPEFIEDVGLYRSRSDFIIWHEE